MVKIDTSDVKKGTILLLDTKFFKVVDFSHTHTGRGSATYNFKVKDMVTGANNTYTFKAGTTLEQADVSTQSGVYLYAAGDSYTFMESDTGEMYEVAADKIDDIVPYLKEDLEVFLLLFEGNVLSVLLPQTITYVIAETVPGVKGDRSNAGKKPAILDNGLEVQVPLHKSSGDEITVNTVTGDAS